MADILRIQDRFNITGISINQEGRKIEVICEQEKRYVFEI